MTLTPFLDAPIHIQIHATWAVLALSLGPVAVYRKRRDRLHRLVGYVWVTAMTLVALTSFFIHSFAVIGPFSPLHGLALLTLWSLWVAIRAAISGQIKVHERIMQNLFHYGLVIASIANFLPGRTINRMFFPATPDAGWWVIAFGGAGIVAHLTWQRFGRQLRRRILA